MDKTIRCVDCGCVFTFTEGEQAWYAEHKFTEPRRCGKCRKAKKQRTEKE